MEPTSTHSTPAKHAVKKMSSSSQVTAAKSTRELADLEAEDDLILKRMEEILMTYKSKVEDHLAAEGRELPKEIFEDFTSRWVSQNAGSPCVRGNNAATPVSKSKSNGSLATVRTTPLMRKEKRDGSDRTRIPMPTYFNINPDANLRN